MRRSGSRYSVGLPAEATSFVDRQHETAEVKRLFSVTRLVTLTGVGGVGKTRLATRVAAQLTRAFPDGVWLVPLAALTDGALVPQTVADVLGVRDETHRETLDVLLDHLREQHLLLVLDNCEHLLYECASLVGAGLQAAANLRVLATSRQWLSIAGEHVLEVLPLQCPQPRQLTQGVAFTNFPAVELFADRAAATVPGFRMSARDQEAVARLCRRLDGLPLAIELAAVRTRAFSIEQLAERLDDRFRLLSAGSGAVPSRHQTLRSAVDWSYELCTRQEQLVWARLSVFAGSFDLRSAEAVCTGAGVTRTDVFDAVVGLVDKSVITREHEDRYTRFRLLSLLRDYGLEKLTEFGEAFATRRRHRDHYLRLAEDYEQQWFGPRQLEIVTHLRVEQDNIRAALDFCLTTPGEARHGLELAGTLWCYLASSGAWAEARHWLQNLALRAGSTPGGVRVRAQWAASAMALIHSRSAAVLLAVDPSDRPAERQDALPVAKPLTGGVLDRQDATSHLMSFIVLSRLELACTLIFRGRPEYAVPLCAEVLTVCKEHGEQWARSYALRTLAMAQWTMGDYASATAHGRECLRLEYVAHDRLALGRTLDLLAAIAASTGDAERGAILVGAAKRIWHEAGADPLASQLAAGRIRTSERMARKALGDHGFEQAVRRGGELPVDDAIAYAQQERPSTPSVTAPQRRRAAAVSGTELTLRERQVAELVANGMTDRQIAETLVIARRTAETHVQHILTKLGFTKRTQVVAWLSSQQAPGERPQSR